jgi:glycolate oxidase FAD binding subunit
VTDDARDTAAAPEACFTAVVGADAVESGPATRAFRVDDVSPRCVVFPTTLEELSRCAAAAQAAGLVVIPAGNGTRLGVGGVPAQYDVALSTRRMNRIIAHEPADMTVTVEAGLTLADLNAALAADGQWLPLDPPHPEAATMGALIAADTAGPVRFSQGKVRDLLIGITAVLADGTVVRGGGRVVKNVAGYDLMKLFTGSFGTLAIIAEATFKIRPRPRQDVLWTVACESTRDAVASALTVVAGSVAPAHVDVLNRLAAETLGIAADRPLVLVGCSGTAEELEVQSQRLLSLAQSQPWTRVDAQHVRTALCNFPADVGSVGCKLSVLPTVLGDVLSDTEAEAARRGLAVATAASVGSGVAFLRFVGDGLDAARLASFADWLRSVVGTPRGWAVFDMLPVAMKSYIDPWGRDVPGLELMRQVKSALDPHNRLSPGRFVGGI